MDSDRRHRYSLPITELFGKSRVVFWHFLRLQPRANLVSYLMPSDSTPLKLWKRDNWRARVDATWLHQPGILLSLTDCDLTRRGLLIRFWALLTHNNTTWLVVSIMKRRSQQDTSSAQAQLWIAKFVIFKEYQWWNVPMPWGFPANFSFTSVTQVKGK